MHLTYIHQYAWMISVIFFIYNFLDKLFVFRSLRLSQIPTLLVRHDLSIRFGYNLICVLHTPIRMVYRVFYNFSFFRLNTLFQHLPTSTNDAPRDTFSQARSIAALSIRSGYVFATKFQHLLSERRQSLGQQMLERWEQMG